jgi:hypothetical protein
MLQHNSYLQRIQRFKLLASLLYTTYPYFFFQKLLI